MTEEQVSFLCRAKKASYAGNGAETVPSRPASHDLQYSEGSLVYIDTYLGGERFSGEEAVWQDGKPVWSMNYAGRVVDQPFSGEFLKAVLAQVPMDKPFRGPDYYTDGTYVFEQTAEGGIPWFQGYEKITAGGRLVYELFFHGGTVI